MKFLLRILPLLLLSACATQKTKYASQSNWKAETNASQSTKSSPLLHRMYLVGDAGLTKEGRDMNAVLESLKEHLATDSEAGSVFYLGDNIYPAGLPKKGNKSYEDAKHQLDAQLLAVEDFKGKVVFIPGNHDWYSNGLKGLKRQEDYLEKKRKQKEIFAPENGCPLEKIELNDQVIVLAIDTQWYITNWNKHPGINDDCDIKSREAFLEEVESQIKKNRDKTVILALHHPLMTYGSHGGYFSASQHLSPVGGIPLPGLGSFLQLLRRSSGASNADMSHPRYWELRKRLLTLAQYSERVVLVSGHEHTLQFNKEANTPQIVSGSGAKKGYTALRKGSLFSTGMRGYARMSIYANGQTEVEFFTVDDNSSREKVYQTQVLKAFKPLLNTRLTQTDFPSTQKASVYNAEEVDKSGFHQGMWGERYRKYYGVEVEAPVALLDTLYGGLTPIRKGGGHQSKSLRLQHADGRQFVLRALRKSAELYLQAIAFKDQYIVGDFEGTVTEGIIQDFYTGSHPYAPFTVAPLAKKLGINHTNPKLVYVPKHAALGGFVEDFGDELYMIEEHVSGGHTSASFGDAKDILSSDDLILKLRKDEDFQLDRKAYIRARLFDMVLGDWDRHPDQWRWAEYKNPDGGKIYKPIPRDRDQAFSRMGDGWLVGWATRVVPSLRLFEGFEEEIRNVRGLNSSPKTFALDISLLSGTSWEDWEEQARFIQENLDAPTIARGWENLPAEVRDQTQDEWQAYLLNRIGQLQSTAREYYAVLHRFGVVRGTDKDDFFRLLMEGDHLLVEGYRIKKEGNELFFSNRFDPKLTKEVWVYALDDEDRFEVLSNTTSIKVRLIGGQGKDDYSVAKGAKGVHIYDQKSKKNDYKEVASGRVHKTDRYLLNTYRPDLVKDNGFQLLPLLGFNPDEGMLVGINTALIRSGFNKPYTAKHQLSAGYYWANNGFDLQYKGHFTRVFGSAGLEIEGRFTSPNFSRNFFGFGNETPNNDEEFGLDFNRVRTRILQGEARLLWQGDLGSRTWLGAGVNSYQIEASSDRFIGDFLQTNPLSETQSFVKLSAGYHFANLDNAAFPSRGMVFGLEGAYYQNVEGTGGNFASILPEITFYQSLLGQGQVVLATKLQGQQNIGDDFLFYQSAQLGGRTGLRGFRFERFSGKSSFSHSSDVRWIWGKRRTGVLPIRPGIFAGVDYGRVWATGDDSRRWHNSYGGGFFIDGAEMLTAQLSLFNSTDGARFVFGFQLSL